MNKQGKVWGETTEIFFKNNVEIHRIVVKPRSYCSKHKHISKFNAFYVEEGELCIEVWKSYGLVDKTYLGTGDFAVVKPGEYHRFVVVSPCPAIVYEIYWTEISREDIERVDSGGRIEQEQNDKRKRPFKSSK